ncbi:MAG: radical SAM protein [Chitinophagales bacterium]
MQQLDCLFINPRDLVGVSPYVKLAEWAAVSRAAGLMVKIIEPAAEGTDNATIARMVQQHRPAVVCISVFPSTLPDAYKLIQFIKEISSSKIVLEGYYVNADPKAVSHLNADYGFRGDADFSFTRLLQHIKAGKEVLSDLEGLVINVKGKLIINEPAFIRDINLLPIPAFDLLPIGKYYSASTSSRYMMLFTTRGCPYKCNFCASGFQMNYRYLSIENIMARLRFLVKDLGVRWVEFMDLTFTVNKRHILELCAAIKAEGLYFEWGCETRADKVDAELLKQMKAAGCSKITFGVESGSEKVRSLTGKKISNHRYKEVFDLCRELGIKTMANFIFGHPGETLQDMEATINLAMKLRPFNILFTRMIPLPDVEVFKIAVQEGKVSSDVWQQYMRSEVELPVYVPGNISRAQLDRIYRKAYFKFYFSPRTLVGYLPLFKNLCFLKNTVRFYLPLAFGSVKFK